MAVSDLGELLLLEAAMMDFSVAVEPEPVVSEVVGGAEFYADGAVVTFGAEVSTVVFFRESEGHPEVVRVFMPRSGCVRSLLNTFRKWAGSRAH